MKLANQNYKLTKLFFQIVVTRRNKNQQYIYSKVKNRWGYWSF